MHSAASLINRLNVRGWQCKSNHRSRPVDSMLNCAGMNNVLAVRVAAVAGFLGVALGAFGAHGLKEVLERHGTTAIWQTAVFYHLVHALMLFILAGRSTTSWGPWFSFGIGIVIFSGSLYVLAVTG